jgi:hypothetical protein
LAGGAGALVGSVVPRLDRSMMRVSSVAWRRMVRSVRIHPHRTATRRAMIANPWFEIPVTRILISLIAFI